MAFHQRTYGIWRGMVQRCSNPAHVSYRYYGAKGVSVCPEWFTYQGFLRDMGVAPPGLSLDRKDNALGYSADNCRWVTVTTQNNNKADTRLITFNGRTQNMTAWARELGFRPATLHHRLFKRGWPVALALTGPITPRTQRRSFSIGSKEIK